MSAADTTTTLEAGIDPATLQRMRRADATVRVLDVRTPSEHENAHIPGSVNIPVTQLKGHVADIRSAANGDPLILVCQTGPRAEQASRLLDGANPIVLRGGVNAWAAAGGTLEQGAPKWAMDRQVRLVAGTLVLAGIAGSLLNPKLTFLSGAVGAGLTFSALSNTCAMARVLGRLPYNRGSSHDAAQAAGSLMSARPN